MFLKGRTKTTREDSRGTTEHTQALVGGVLVMREKLFRIVITLASIAAVALAGGATIKVF